MTHRLDGERFAAPSYACWHPFHPLPFSPQRSKPAKPRDEDTPTGANAAEATRNMLKSKATFSKKINYEKANLLADVDYSRAPKRVSSSRSKSRIGSQAQGPSSSSAAGPGKENSTGTGELVQMDEDEDEQVVERAPQNMYYAEGEDMGGGGYEDQWQEEV